MESLCMFLLGIIGIGLFFYMMICGWGLEIKAGWPIIAYYVFWVFSLAVREYIKKKEK